MERIIEGLTHIQLTHYSQLASSTIIVFDHVVTFGDEVELIWGSSWSLQTFLFVLNRYYSLGAVIFNNYGFFSSHITDEVIVRLLLFALTPCAITAFSSCLRFFQWQGWTGLVGAALAEGILQLRLYALYSKNKKILTLMLVTFMGSVATAGWIMASVLEGITAKATTIPGGKFCVPRNVSGHFFIFWIPMLAFESLLCTLALIQGFRTFKNEGGIFRNGRQLVALLVRDSIFYFLIIGGTYASCLLVWLLASPGLLEVPIGFTIAMSCVLSNRIILNVRKVGREKDETTSPLEQTGDPDKIGWETSFCSPGCLTAMELGLNVFELEQPQPPLPLETRPQSTFSDIVHYYQESSDGGHVDFPWKVL